MAPPAALLLPRVSVRLGHGELAEVLACQEPAVDGMDVETGLLLSGMPSPALQQLAGRVAEALEHELSGRPGEAAALQYDPDGSVRGRLRELLRKAGDRGARNLRRLLQSHPHVHLDGAGFDDFDFLVIAQIAAEAPGAELKMLNLNSNRGGDAGCGFVTESVLQRQQLRSLFLSGNGITDAGAARLAGALPQCRALSILELRKNRITDSGAQCLARALRGAGGTDLGYLYLSGNQIGDEGAWELVHARCESAPALKIWLAGNEVSEAVQERIGRLVGKGVKF